MNRVLNKRKSQTELFENISGTITKHRYMNNTIRKFRKFNNPV